MSNDIGITSVGVYVPSLRMSRKAIANAHSWALPSLKGLGRGMRSFSSWDEDAITMAVEAVRNCNKAYLGQISALSFASTTQPFSDYSNASCVAAAANLPVNIRTTNISGTLRAGTSALIQALETTNTQAQLIVASDNRRTKPGSVQEMHYGAASACLSVGTDNIIAKYLGAHSLSVQFADHYRPAGEPYDYYWEERWSRDEGYLKIIPETIYKLLQDTHTRPEDIDHVCVPGTIRRLGQMLAKSCNLNEEAFTDNLASNIGDTGTPQAFLMLVRALETAKPGEKILVIGFGSGCDALLFEVTDHIAAIDRQLFKLETPESIIPVEHYNQFLSFSGELQLDWGMRAEVDNKLAVSELHRSQTQISGFNGGKCSQCGAIQFPILSTCVSCGSTEKMTPISLADAPAKVATFTSDFLQYYPAPPMYWGLVQFDNGARLLMEMIDVDASTFAVGTQLSMVYRIKQKDERRGLHRYFWKATPSMKA